MDWKTILFGFDGRLNRAKYWFGVLITFVTCLAGGLLAVPLVVGLGETVGYPIAIVVGIAVFIAIAWIALATGVTRLHDRDKSAWWLLLFYVLPFLFSAVGSTGNNSAELFSLVGSGISIWALVELGCLKGTTGPNAYGPDPLPPEST